MCIRDSAHTKRYEYDQAIQDYDHALRLSPGADDYYSRGWAYYQKGAYVFAFRDFARASWLRPAILGRWIWTPLLPALWLVSALLRRRKAKQAESNGTVVPDAARV